MYSLSDSHEDLVGWLVGSILMFWLRSVAFLACPLRLLLIELVSIFKPNQTIEDDDYLLIMKMMTITH